MVKFRTLSVPKSELDSFIAKLQESGASARNLNAPYVLWSGLAGQSIITVYTSGKVVFDVKDEVGEQLVDQLGATAKATQQIKGGLAMPTRKWAVGLDETGTGELFGRVILAGALANQDALEQMLPWLRKTNTKASSHSDNGYWFQKEKELQEYLLQFPEIQVLTFPINNDLFDRPKIKNKLMDQYYLSSIISPFVKIVEKRNISANEVEMVIDDYRIGLEMRREEQKLAKNGYQMVIQTKADDSFAVVRLAAIAARIARAHEVEEFNAPEFVVNGVAPGNGNVGHPQTKEWLRSWRTTGKPWPSFVKQWFKTVNEL